MPSYIADYLNSLGPGAELDEVMAAIRAKSTPIWGDWVPDPNFSGLNVGMAYSLPPDGRWMTDGKLMKVWGRFAFSAKGSSVGEFRIGGLPLASGVTVPAWAGTIGYAAGLVGITNIRCTLNAAEAFLRLYDQAGSFVTDAGVSNAFSITFAADFEIP